MQLVPRVRGLVRLCRLSKVLERYRGRLTDTLKGVVKTVLLEYLDMADYQQPQGGLFGAEDGEQQRADGSGSGALTSPSGLGGSNGKAGAGAAATTNALTAKVKAMPARDFLDCLRLCLEQMLLPLERAALVHAFLEEQISVELSRLLDRRAARSSSASAAAGAGATFEPLSPLPPASPGGAGAGGGPAPVPPSSPPRGPTGQSKSDKFKSFLDKRRMETQGAGALAVGGAGASAAGAQGKGGVGGVGAGGGGGGGVLRDEEQIKLLELQACKRLNDEILKALCDLAQRHVASLLGGWGITLCMRERVR